MSTSLFALELGASAATVGVLMALFAALPMLLSIAAGRRIDRFGSRRPLAWSLALLAAAMLLPFAVPRLETLYLSSTLLGTAFMVVHIAMNSVIGAHGPPEARALNFSWLALSFSASGALGPLVAGYAIDHLGHPRAFALLAAFPLAALAALAARRRPLPEPDRHAGPAPSRSFVDLLRQPRLAPAFLVSALLATGWDLYAFLMPVYGAKLGLAAATIGVVMATFAAATFFVRLAMPLLVRRVAHWRVITTALGISGIAYVLFPLFGGVPMLMALSFLLGLGLGCAQPVIMALLFEASPPGRQSEVIGLRTALLNASHTFIPIVSGAVSAAAGMAPAFWLVAAGLLGGGWFARRR